RGKYLWITALLLPALCHCGGGGSASRYEVVDIGTLPGGNQSEGFAINPDGIVVGKAPEATWNGHYFPERAFLWQKGVIRDLGALPGRGGSEARGINLGGDIVGTSFVAEVGGGVGDTLGRSRAPGTTRGFLYALGRFTELSTLGGNTSSALALNAHDIVVGT